MGNPCENSVIGGLRIILNNSINYGHVPKKWQLGPIHTHVLAFSSNLPLPLHFQVFHLMSTFQPGGGKWVGGLFPCFRQIDYGFGV